MGSMISRIHKELTAEDIGAIARTYHLWRGEPVDLSDVGSRTSDAKSSEVGSQTSDANTTASDANSSDVGRQTSDAYQDVAGFCKSATLADIQANDYVLTPGRYVGAADVEDDGELFEEKMQQLTQTLYQQMAQAQELDAVIKQNLKGLGYGE
jgi:type I restriction enzyme M protein